MDQIGKINALVALLGYLCIGVMAGRAVEESPSAAFRFAEADNKAVPDFQKHVIPLLGKLGCSSAKCHGSFQGQGDFRLSLFGFGFQKDHAALLAEASSEDGHRISPELPSQSLILLKPTKQIKHRGGEIIKEKFLGIQPAASLDRNRSKGNSDYQEGSTPKTEPTRIFKRRHSIL